MNGQFHIPAVLVPVTDCELVRTQGQVRRSEEINRMLLPTIEPRFLCVKFPRRPMYRYVNMLMISSWIERIFIKNVGEKKTHILYGIYFSGNRAVYKRYGRASEVFEIVDDRK